MSIKLITPLGNGLFREEDQDAPYNESTRAREDSLGTFRIDNPIAVATNIAGSLGGVDAAAPIFMVAPRPGKIMGVAGFANATITAGFVRLDPTVNGVVATNTGATLSPTATGNMTNLATTIPFAQGALLGVSASMGASGIQASGVDLSAQLLVKWDV